MESRRRVVITGIGVVSPIGIGKESFWSALIRGQSGVKNISSFEAASYPTQVAGEICDFDPLDFMCQKDARRTDRSCQMILASAVMALEDSKLNLDEDLSKFGVFTGTAVGGQGWAFREYEIFREKGIKRINPFTAISTFPNATSTQISFKLGFKGPSDTISSGCASSTVALGYAADNLRAGRLDVAFVGGTEAPLDPGIFGAYCAARVMTMEKESPHRVPRPFDVNRDGIVLSEGSAVLVCETLEHALERGAKIYAEIAGWSHNTDPHSMMMMNPDAIQAQAVIQQTIADSRVSIQDIDYIQAHGPGTKADDATEALAIKSVFRDSIDRIPVVSIKSMLGHTQGACGAIEGAAAALSTYHQVIPPTINCDTIDPACSLTIHRHEAASVPIGCMLMNTFGFGGKNVSVVFKAVT